MAPVFDRQGGLVQADDEDMLMSDAVSGEQYEQSNGDRKARLVIQQIVMENFKSYAGRQVIGPFHKSFTSIVGPNGSGKSNVIDAFMFVLGFRAKKMRQGKLADLIHNSEGAQDIESCTVEVHFRSIIDTDEEGGFEVVSGSDFVVSRTAYRNSRNVYHVNGQSRSATEVTELMKRHGVDLDHNRFLILQGEVESIAQMKPKAANEHEEGLLEYLEDIIGTSDYIKPIEDAGKAMEEAAEVFTEKQVRVRAAAKECDALHGEKEKAEGFLRQENALAELKSQKIQALLFQLTHELEGANKRVAENSAKLAAEREKFAAEKEQMDKVAAQLDAKGKSVKDKEAAKKELEKGLTKLEQEDVRLQETRKHLKNKTKGLQKTLNDTQKQKTELNRELETCLMESKGVRDQIENLQASLAHEETELGKVCKSLEGVTGKFQAELETRQRQLVPFNEKLRKEQQVLEIAVSERDMLCQKQDSMSMDLSNAEGRVKELEEELNLAREDKERLDDELQRVQRRKGAVEDELSGLTKQEASLGKEIDVLAGTISEAKESLNQASSGGTILLSLMKEKRAGRLPGVHGRLGDLGTIEGKYDTAISTACGMLNHIVVDSTETGQRCIEYLRKHSLGRANFIILDKMRPPRGSPGDLPNGAKRLVDLVKVKDGKAYGGAFAFALGETLVAETIEEATRWAYQGSKRNRVVTLDGKVIETSGTISGGGRPQRNGMKAKLDDGVTQEQVNQLEACLAEQRQYLRKIQGRIAELSGEKNGLLDCQSRNEALFIKAETLCANLPIELKDLQEQLPGLRQGKSGLKKGEQERLQKAERTIKEAEAKMKGIRDEMTPLEASVATIQAQIMEAGGIKFKAQQAKVDGLKDQLAHQQGRMKKLSSQLASLEARVQALTDNPQGSACSKKFEAELEEVERRILEHTEQAMTTKTQLDQAIQELDDAREEWEELKKQQSEYEKHVSKFRKIEYELKVKVEEDQETIRESSAMQIRLAHEATTLTLHHIDLKEAKPELTVYEDPEDLNEILKKMSQVDSQIRGLTERLQAMTPNLKVLEEYRRRSEYLAGLEDELQQLDTTRTAARERFEGLRQKRYDEFMAGFKAISMRLKELYQLITMGGNAELELVDSLDPFSEGILFSVMPPRKSWKIISNLSGGEKTLSSLALVFALHTYRPTPIYVMDEIDAALDFRNVSIVAHYIKERTRDAQFIVISLRNDMFELADRLVGIYKTDQKTKSVTIDPGNFTLSQPTATA